MATSVEDAGVGLTGEGFCDGSPGIKLVVMEALGPGSLRDFYVLERYHGAYLLIDGSCRFYAFDFNKPRLMVGVLSAELLQQLTADLTLDSIAELPSSKDTTTDHYSDVLLATPTQSLRCRNMECRSPEASATLEKASMWLDKLSAQGTPSTGALSAFAFPELDLASGANAEDTTQHAVPWPLTPTLRSLRKLVSDDFYSSSSGLEFAGDEATSLRELRSAAIALHPTRYTEPTFTEVSDCGQNYRLLLRDELPSRLHGDFIRFLEQAWARPVITSCIPDFNQPEVTPCPADD